MNPLAPSQSVEALQNDTQGQVEQTYIECIADAAVFEQFRVTCPTGAAAAEGDFVWIRSVSGTKFAAWLDIDAAGTTPSGTIFTAANQKKKVSILSTDTAVQVAGKLKTALEATTGFSAAYAVVDNANGTLTVTSIKLGDPSDAVAYAANEVAASSLAVAQLAAGVASSLQNKYIVLHDGDGDLYYAWFNVNSEGSDPAPGGTGIEVDIAGGASASAVSSALGAALDAAADFDADADGSRVKVSTVEDGDVVDATAGNSGFTVSVRSQGHAGTLPGPSTSVSSLTNF